MEKIKIQVIHGEHVVPLEFEVLKRTKGSDGKEIIVAYYDKFLSVLYEVIPDSEGHKRYVMTKPMQLGTEYVTSTVQIEVVEAFDSETP
jgi:hypothetical protein